MPENSFDARGELEVGGRTYTIYRLDALQSKYDIARLPFSLKVLLENVLRNEDGVGVRADDAEAIATWDHAAEPSKEIAFTPARVVMQDFTGVPAVVDLAAMRDAMQRMGGDPAHISVVPNHQVGRVTPFKTRGEVAFTGAFGYELDVSILSNEDRAEIRRQTALYKQVRHLFIEGDLYRLRSPFETNEAAWMVVSPARDEALVTHVTILSLPNAADRSLRLKGLDTDAQYQIGDITHHGDALTNIGLPIPYPSGDFLSHVWHLRKVA